jgi:tRNA nucleotidyltransferase (CCA-adding enzyme)
MPITPPPGVREIAAKLTQAGHQAWCVGGAVRDALMGRPQSDWDLATDATPDVVLGLFRRTVPVGVQHGTVGVFDSEGDLHEVTTFRHDVETDGRHAVVRFGASIDEDLARRDFTINAIAVSPLTGEVRDPFHGRRDLHHGIVRAVGNPAERMREDRLRALRAIRFAARLGFSISRPTWEAIIDCRDAMGALSKERVRQEIDKTLSEVERPSDAFRLWKGSWMLQRLAPELAEQDWRAVLAVDFLPLPKAAWKPAERERRLRLRWAALVSELDSGTVSDLLTRLKAPRREIDWTCAFAGKFLAFRYETDKMFEAGPWSNADVRRWAAKLGSEHADAAMLVAQAWLDHRRSLGYETPPQEEVVTLWRRLALSVRRDALTVGDLAIDGTDLQQAGVKPGPALGRILRGLLDRVIETPSLNTRENLLSLVDVRLAHEE